MESERVFYMSKKKSIKKNVQNYFTELVKIDSPSGSEKNVAEYLKTWLKSFGFKITEDKVGNVFAAKGASKRNPAFLLLCAHMDTVHPGNGIQPILQNGVFTSTGNTILGADNKAAIAAMMSAVEQFLADSHNQFQPLEILFTVKEETGGGIEHFDFSQVSAKTVLICDYAKPIGTIALGAPFIINFSIEFIGKAAHASKPEKGVNAFFGLSDFLSELKVGVLDNKLTTINIGEIFGGSGANTVPEKCFIKGEVRSFKEVLFVQHLQKIEKMVKKISVQNNLQFSFSTDGYCPGYLYEETDAHLQQAKKIIEAVTNKTVAFEKTFGVSDANILAPLGFETILISDGVKNPHTTDESVAVKDLELLQRIIMEFIEDRNL